MARLRKKERMVVMLENSDIVSMLNIAAGRVDGWDYQPHKGHEGDLYAQAADEIERLRALIIAWAEVDDAVSYDDYVDTLRVREQARDALRQAVGR